MKTKLLLFFALVLYGITASAYDLNDKSVKGNEIYKRSLIDFSSHQSINPEIVVVDSDGKISGNVSRIENITPIIPNGLNRKSKVRVLGDPEAIFQYSYNDENLTATLVSAECLEGEFTVPETVENDGKTYAVTAIGDEALSNLEYLTSLTIGKNIVSIGETILYKSINVSSIAVDPENPVYDSRNNCNAIIETNTNVLLVGCNNTIIPDNVVSIGSSAFAGLNALVRIVIPEGVTSIGETAFHGCTSLAEISLPSSLNSIGAGAFYQCSGLREITIPDNITDIDELTFYECEGLSKLTLGSSLKTIGRLAFCKCRNLELISIPNSVTTIGYGAFNGCSYATSIYIGKNVTYLDEHAFSYLPLCKSIRCYCTIPPQIQENSFAGTTNATLNVNWNCKQAYLSALYWNAFSNINEIAIPVTSISFNKTELSIGLNSSEQLEATVSPEDASNKNLIWSSSDNNVATVDENGLVTAIAFGTAMITATSHYNRSIFATIEVNVYHPTAVAHIGNAFYDTVSSAVDAAQNDETITMLADVDVTQDGIQVTNKTVTLDLNGHNIKAGENESTNILVTGNLTIVDNSAEANGKIYTETVYSSENNKGVVRVTNGGSLTLNSGNIEAVIDDNPSNKGQFAIVGREGSTVTINGGTVKAGWYAYSNNGTDTEVNTLTVNGGTLLSVADYAIYNPAQNSSVIINDGVVDGAAGGVSLNGGSLTMNGGTVQSFGTGDTGSWSDGTSGQGNAAINVNAKYAASSAIITGGTVLAGGNAQVITAGTNNVAKIAVSGGQFSAPIPEEFCANGYKPATTPDENGLYTVIGLKYSFDNDNMTATLISGAGCEGEVVIPNTIDKNGKTYTVTAIAENAFKDCAAITAITIPEGVTSIGDYAFAGCTGITTVNYNAVNAEYSHIETVWDDFEYGFYINFDSHYRWFKDCPLTNLIIGDNVKHIPAGLAYNQTGLTSIVIPESVTSIGDYAFSGCTGVSSLIFNASSVNYKYFNPYWGNALPEYAWFKDLRLTSLTIGESVKTIPVALAYGQKLLTSIEIPSGVTIIDSYAFDGCSNLTEITIPESVQVIYRTTLSNMPNLKKLTVNTDASWSTRMGDDPELPVLYGSPIEELVLGKNVKVIPGKFNYCEPYGCTGESLKKITIFATTPPEIELGYYGGAEPFGYFESELYIPKGTYDDYKNSYWGNFMNMYMIDEEGNVLASEIQLNCYYDEYYGGYLVDLEDTRSTTVKATVFPEIAANKNVIWSSSNPYEASVDENGVITAHSWGGECTITATAADGGGASASITVRTHPLIVSSISIDQQDISIVEGESAQLTVSFDPIEATNKYCTWRSSDNKVATVNYDGVVTAHSLGTAIITAISDDGPMATTTITVTPAANHLAVPAELTCGMGETVELKIELNNEAEIAAFQFDLNIPKGFVLAKNYKGKDDITLSRGQGHTLMYNNGRVMAYSVSTAPFTGHSGVILKVRLVATPDVKDGQQYTVGYKNIVLTESNGKTYTTADRKTVITAENHVLLGDVDSDGVVDVADVLLTANKAIDKEVEDFSLEAGDVNKDGKIDVTDVVLVANIALGKDINIAAAPRMGESVDNMFFNKFMLKRGEEKTVSVSLDNTFGFAAFQMNLNLPYGVELVKARLTGRADGHSIMTNKKLDGSVTMLAYNLASSNFNGNEGALLELTLKADDSFAGYGDFVLSNITLAESNGHSREVSDVVSTVSVVTGVSDIYSEVRVYTVDNVIVIETPDAGDAQIICANGMNRTIKVNAGRNTYTVVENGVYIVRVGGKAVKVVI